MAAGSLYQGLMPAGTPHQGPREKGLASFQLPGNTSLRPSLVGGRILKFKGVQTR